MSSVFAMSARTEDIGGRAAEALLSVGLPGSLRARLVRAMWEELIHADIFMQLTAGELMARTGQDRAWLQLERVLTAAETDLQLAVIHTELEAMALDVFLLIAANHPHATIRRVYTVVAADEATHVALGNSVTSVVARRSREVSEDVRVAINVAQSVGAFNDVQGFTSIAQELGLRPGPTCDRLWRRAQGREQRLMRLLDNSREEVKYGDQGSQERVHHSNTRD